MSERHRIVSSENEELVLVDRDDNELGHLSKSRCHDGAGVLHRAFSLFLFNDAGELLLQQRGDGKRLWPGFWSNSCCSHPRRGESMEIATVRRLNDELNIETELEYVYRFCYTAQFGEAGSENELCHVYLGKVTGHVEPNGREIANIRFVSRRALDEELSHCPERFTPWFKQEWQELKVNYHVKLAQYLEPALPE